MKLEIKAQGSKSSLRTIQGVTERSTDAKADSMNLHRVEVPSGAYSYDSPQARNR